MSEAFIGGTSIVVVVVVESLVGTNFPSVHGSPWTCVKEKRAADG